MFRRYYLITVIGALLALLIGALPGGHGVQAQERLCFSQTEQCIEGRFLRFWQDNGGLSVFGYPITVAREERNRETGKSYLTQWFERNRFEYHPENQPPYDVLLGRLGDDALRALGRDWQQLPGDDTKQAGCLWFAQTQFNVCNQSDGSGAQAGFMSYWQTEQLQDPRLSPYERSLALFGLPLTRPRMETNATGDTVLTQWFERARMEWHPNNPPGFRVLLGLLATEARGGTTPQEPVSRLKYLWPRMSPLTVMHEPRSSANEHAFVLHLAWPHATEPDATISGGATAVPPEGKGTRVTVRGQNGTLYTLGARRALAWTEDGQFYLIVSTLRQSELLALGNDLDALDLATFRARLQP
jgi:hypothetical protein